MVFAVIILVCGGMSVAGGIQIARYVRLRQNHSMFQNAVLSHVQSISTVTIPDTKIALIQEITTMLDDIGALYGPQHIQVTIEKAKQRLVVQVWYWQYHKGLFTENPKMFYTYAEKNGIAEIVEPVNLVSLLAGAIPSPEIPAEQVMVHSTPTPEPTVTVSPAKYTAPLTATDDTFRKVVLQSSVPVLVDFWAEWCGPCRQAVPAVDAAARRFSGQVTIVKVNVDRNKKTTSRYGIRGIPTFLMFKDGQAVGRQSGFGGQQQLFGFINRYL